MGLRSVVSKRLGLLVAGAALVLGMIAATAPAEARGRYRHYSKHRVHTTWHVKRHVHIRKRHYARARAAAPVQMPAEFVVDVNSGKVLHSHNENAERHPASLTKVMTLYLLFEQIEAGRLKLDSEIPISSRAAAQSPSKLGLRPGSDKSEYRIVVRADRRWITVAGIRESHVHDVQITKEAPNYQIG